MFRAFAHQIYNDSELHTKVRAACYDHMVCCTCRSFVCELINCCCCFQVKERDFFSRYVSGDFGIRSFFNFLHTTHSQHTDAYVARQKKLTEWGDHLEIECMRELYNKNVEVYDKDAVKCNVFRYVALVLIVIAAAKPLGMSDVDLANVPVVRLSYHGGNHYNSVLVRDPPTKLPLGDGKDVRWLLLLRC